MATYSPLLRPLGIAAGLLRSVSIKNNVAFTCLKHVGISIFQAANTVKYKLFLLNRTSVCATFLHLTSASDYLDATEHVIRICC